MSAVRAAEAVQLLLAPTLRDNTTSYVRCVIPMRRSTVREHRTSLSQMLNMADPNPSVTLILLPCPPAPGPTFPLCRFSHHHFSLVAVSACNWIKLWRYIINPKSQILKA